MTPTISGCGPIFPLDIGCAPRRSTTSPPLWRSAGRAIEDIGEVDVQENWVHDEWVRPRFDPSTDAWVVTEPGEEVVAATYTWGQEPHTLFDSAGWVHPAHRGRGIGTALVLAVEGRAVRDLAELPAGSAPRVLQSFDADASGAHDPDASGARALFEELGYSPEREYLHMEIDMPDGLVAGDAPVGIVVRPRTEADDRDIVAVMADAFDDPLDYEEARRNSRSRRPAIRLSGSSPWTATRRSGCCSVT